MKRVLVRLCLLVISVTSAAATAVAGDDWKPVDPGHLALKTPVVDKDADAEAIFWEVRINDAGQDLVLSHYIRIKVFTERGKETQSKIDLEFLGRNRIADVAGRTIKPDGTIIELKKDAVFERTIAKVGGFKIKAKSFAMPAVEPGVIIEYRWREVRPYQMANYIRLQFQRDIPIHSVTYFLKPAQFDIGYSPMAMMSKAFNGTFGAINKGKDGFYSTSMTNMPAFRAEPRMPPEDQVRTWMLLYYARANQSQPEQYWPKIAKELYEETKSLMKVNDEIKKASASAVGDAATPDQKLQRLFDFCRAKIKNIDDDASGLTEADLEKLKRNESPADTLKRGVGTGRDINLLFAALASAAGFEPRIARLPDRSDIFFDINFLSTYFLDLFNIAIKAGDRWRFFDPAAMYVPFGMLRWQEEGVSALICDPKEPNFVMTPISPAEKSSQKRTAKLKLSEDGTLEGTVRIEYSGQLAAEKKEQNDDDSPAQREENLREMVKSRMSTAILSDIKIENATDLDKPFVYTFHVRVPDYAQRTGKRLFIQPSFFQKGIGALFSASTRKHSIYFHYPSLEDDDLTIELPPGFVLDNADQPAPFRATDVAEYNVKIGVAGKAEALVYKRTFSFSGMVFPVSSYSPLKQFFHRVHEGDNHTITLKQAVATQ